MPRCWLDLWDNSDPLYSQSCWPHSRYPHSRSWGLRPTVVHCPGPGTVLSTKYRGCYWTNKAHIFSFKDIVDIGTWKYFLHFCPNNKCYKFISRKVIRYQDLYNSIFDKLLSNKFLGLVWKVMLKLFFLCSSAPLDRFIISNKRMFSKCKVIYRTIPPLTRFNHA